MTTILVFDIQTIFREMLRKYLSELGFQNFGASNLDQAFQTLSKNKVDIIIMDVNMPEIGGIDTLSSIRSKYPSSKIIVLSYLDEPSLVLQLLRLGANSFLSKRCEVSELLTSIDVTLKKGHYYNEYVMDVLNRNLTTPKSFASINLSPREKQILIKMKEGLTNKEMANELNLEVYTIESYRKNIMEKTKTKNIADLMMFAVRTGLI